MSSTSSEDSETEEDLSLNREKLLTLVKAGKRTFIYKCTKPELQTICAQENITYSAGASLDELRRILSEFYKNKPSTSSTKEKVKTKMSVYGELKQFEGEKWEVFEQQLECYIIVNDIEVSKKVPLLITKLSPKVFETLTYLCTPNKPTKFTYEELCLKLKDKYAKPLSTAIERAEFRKRDQLSNEKIQDYVLELRKMAGKCKFKDIDDQIKEKFMNGVSSKVVKFELMKSSTDMTLDNCIELARTVEAALLHSNNTNEVSEVFYNQKKQKPKQEVFKKKTNNSQNNPKCFCCGKPNHMKSECYLKDKFCSECGQKGHIYKMCTKRKVHTNILEAGSSDSQRTEDIDTSIKDLFTEYDTYTYNSMPNN